MDFACDLPLNMDCWIRFVKMVSLEVEIPDAKTAFIGTV